MTAPPDVPPRAFSTLPEAIAALRRAGLRLSTPRRLVLEALFSAEGPVSAAHLARALSLDESSVYRNLELLQRHGVVRHIHLGHSPGLYVLSGAEDVEYLYCERCERVTALAPARLDGVREQIRAELGHAVRFAHFALVGVCASCAQQPAGTPGEMPADGPESQLRGAVARSADRARTRESQPHSHGGYVHSHPDASAPHRH